MYSKESWSIVRSSSRRHLRGATAVEFALSFVAFLPFLLGAFEMARFAYVRNAAAEAARIGARTIANCSPGTTTVNKAVAKMRVILPQIPENYTGYVTVITTKGDMSTTCSSASDCAYVTVRLSGIPVATVIPLVNLDLVIPTVSSTMPRELMSSTNNDYCS